MDNCHARYQRAADSTGHGKNFFEGEKKKGLPCGKCFIDENA